MIIRYNPRQFFQGRMYTENHPEGECAVSGTNHGPTFLTIPLGTQTKEQLCGINRAYDYESPNRTLIFTYIIIQNNPLVQMQSDRYLKVGCISRNNKFYHDGIPDYVSLETSMEFNGKDYDGSGSLVIDNGGDIPRLKIFILDPIDNVPIKTARIGQILKFVISMETYYDNYDLRALNLTATSEYDQLSLISATSCAVNSAIFPPFQQERSEHSRRLVSKFKAFKFASSSQIKFTVAVQFCYKECKPINCGNGIISYGRRKKRETTAGIVNKSPTPTLSRIIFPDENSTTTKAPLEPIKFPEKLVSEPVSHDEDETYNGLRLNAFGQPIGIQNYFSGIHSENEVPEDSEIKRQDKIVTIPLDVTIKIIDQDINGTDRLVIGENDQIIVAGLGRGVKIELKLY